MKYSLRGIAKTILLAVLLTVVRYVVGLPIEWFLIYDKLNSIMTEGRELFNVDWTPLEHFYSVLYNFLGWLLITVLYVKIESVVHGHPVRKSLKLYAVMYMYFVSVSGIYMLRYNHPSDFYLYMMLDRLLLFSIVAIANGILHPRLFRPPAPATRRTIRPFPAAPAPRPEAAPPEATPENQAADEV
jgi:hypothetical protein